MSETAEILLRGLTVARDVVVDGAFLQFERPLPVGTRVVVKVDGQDRDAVVKRVVEKGEAETTGMEVVFEAVEKKSEPKKKTKTKRKRTTKAMKAVDAPMEVVEEFKTQRYGETEVPVPKKKGRKKKK